MQIKTNKEYTSLQGEIALLKKGCSEIEEVVIVSLDEIAEIEQQIAEEKKRLESKRTELESEKRTFEVLGKENRFKIDTLTKERDALLSPLEKQVRTLYEKIVAKRQGNALSKIEGEQCSGCGMRIRPQIINEVRMCDQVVVCDNCMRILYVD
jgi:predicted  nucleic acid-binding Zn-ribbon protein